MSVEMGFNQAEKIISKQSFVIDTLAIQEKNKQLVGGSYTFVSSILSWTFGKVHFVSSAGESKTKMMSWFDKWRISSHPFFINEQVWDTDMPITRLVSRLNMAQPGHVVLITPSHELSGQVATNAKAVRTIEFSPEGSDIKDLWKILLNKNYWR